MAPIGSEFNQNIYRILILVMKGCSLAPLRAMFLSIAFLCCDVNGDLDQKLADKIVSSISEFIVELEVDSVELTANNFSFKPHMELDIDVASNDLNLTKCELSADETRLFTPFKAYNSNNGVKITPQDADLQVTLNTPEYFVNVDVVTDPEMDISLDAEDVNIDITLDIDDWDFEIHSEVEDVPMTAHIQSGTVPLDIKMAGEIELGATTLTKDIYIKSSIPKFSTPRMRIGSLFFGSKSGLFGAMCFFQLLFIVYFLVDKYRFKRQVATSYNLQPRHTKCYKCDLGNVSSYRFCAGCGAHRH